MSNIESFNILLNTTKDDRYQRWVEFREGIDSSLLRVITGLESRKLAIIIGAGRCEDFSLKQFVNYFERVILSDIDVESIFNAHDYLMLTKEEKARVEVVKVEYTGVENSGLFDDLVNRISKLDNFDDIEELLLKGFGDFKNYKFLKKYSADMVYVSPIYTQLIYQQLLMVCSKLRSVGYSENLLKYIENYSVDKLVEVFEVFNKNLERITNGRLVVASDIFQDYSNSDFMKRIKKDFSKGSVDSIYNQYLEDYGFGMGDLGLYLLNESIELLDYEWHIWPFVEGSDMVVKLAIYKK